MRIKSETTIQRDSKLYELKGGFILERYQTPHKEYGTQYDFWLYHKNCGVKDLCIGVYEKFLKEIPETIDEFTKRYINDEVIKDIKMYEEDYMARTTDTYEMEIEKYLDYLENKEQNKTFHCKEEL